MASRRTHLATAASLLRSPIGGLRSMAVQRGVLGGRRGWMILAAVLWGARLLRRASSRRPEIVAIERLQPGQSVHITALSSRRGGPAT
jgi:hypothetical protein